MFKGFPQGAFEFFTHLEDNNNRPWFELNRDLYDRSIRQPALDLIDELGKQLKRKFNAVSYDARENKSLFRIFRDTRFSQDKSPYKTHLGIKFPLEVVGDSKSPCRNVIYYLEISSTQIYLGAGVKEFDKGALARYRTSLTNPKVVTNFEAITCGDILSGYQELSQRFAKRPLELKDINFNDNALPLRKGFFFGVRAPHSKSLHSRDFVDFCMDRYDPLHKHQKLLFKVLLSDR